MTLALDTSRLMHVVQASRRYEIIGKVTEVVGLVVEGYLPQAPIGAICEIRPGGDEAPRLAEVIGLKGDKVQMMIIGDTAGVTSGSMIRVVEKQARVKVGHALLGRVVDSVGAPLDTDTPLALAEEYSLYADPSHALHRKRIATPMRLGIRAMDGLMTCGEGQRLCIMAGSGVGKSTLMGMMARHTSGDVNVIALLGERGREVRDFIEKDLGAEGLAKSVVVVSTSDDPPLLRVRCAFMATAIAEYFRDQGKKVLLMMDSLTRFAMALREVGLSVGEPPTSRGYTPTVFTTMPKLLERAGTTEHDGSITGFYTVLSEGDDINDPIADCVRSIVDGHITLSRKLANEGHFPAIDVLNSLSRVMTDVAAEPHLASARKIRSLIATYTEMQDYINIGAYSPGKNAELDEAVKKIQHIRQFLRQDVAEKNNFEETVQWLGQLAR